MLGLVWFMEILGSLVAAAGFKIEYSPGSKGFTAALCCLFQACADKSSRPQLPLGKSCGLSGACCGLQIVIDGGASLGVAA